MIYIGCYLIFMFKINSNILFNITSSEKAYLNGYFYGISTRVKDEIMYVRYSVLIENILRELEIESETFEKDCTICFLQDENNHLSPVYSVIYPINNEYKLEFIRGMFENSDNSLNLLNPCSCIKSYSKEFLIDIQSYLQVKSSLEEEFNFYSLNFIGYNGLDFCDLIYKNKGNLYDIFYFNHYLELCCFINVGDNITPFNQISNSFLYVKNDINAVDPFKERASDSGYDLTLVKKIKTVGNVDFYDTCISVQPPFGMYFDLIGRSSISKSGYILANNMGIIDRSYTGSIIVPLIKINSDLPDLQLPNRLVQIIPRHVIHLQATQITNLLGSDRAGNGFGSTN
jgi:dUTP pyrophosphatase